MLTANRDLMQQAREALKGRWGLAVGGNVIYLILGVLIQAIPLVGWIGGLIIGGPLMLGMVGFFWPFPGNRRPNFHNYLMASKILPGPLSLTF